MSRLQWAEFFKNESNGLKHKKTIDIIEEMKINISKKAPNESKENLRLFKKSCAALVEDFDTFISENCDENETFRFWNTFLNMMTKLENLIRSDRNGDWKLHLQTVKDLLPIFAAFDSTDYLRW